MSALLPLFAAIQTRLEANVALMAIVAAVYDDQAPTTAALPHIEIGAATETPDNVFGRVGHQDTVTLHLRSNARTRTEVLEIADLIDAALAAPLTLTGHTSARCRREFREVLTDIDGSRHVPIRYRVLTFAAA